MKNSISRRTFLKAATGAAAISAAAPVAAEVHPPGWRGSTRVQQIATNCEMCIWRCGVMAEVADGKLLKLQGNAHHPLTKGKLCARGNAGVALLNDPDRLKYPQIRTGERGEGKFKRVSWDEALDFFANKLQDIKKKYGPEGVALFPHGVHSGFFSTLMKAYGTPNSAEPAYAQCKGPRDVAYLLTFGRPVNSPEPVDLEESKCIVLIGSHIGENVFTSQVAAFSDGLAKGAKLIVVDPRFSTAASKAHYWLPIKPGTDTALLLAWMNVIITEKLYDKEYLDQYAIGFKELEAHVQQYTPEWAESITEIPAAKIRETAHLMADCRPAVALHPGRHVTWYGNDTQRGRAMAILTALLGAYGRKGGIFLPTKIPQGKIPLPPMPESERSRADRVGSVYPLASEEAQGLTQGLIETTLTGNPYPIKAWVVYGQNIFESIPLPQKTHQAIKNLEFMAVVDVLPMEQTRYADIVLPEATYLERYDPPAVVTTAKRPFISVRQPAVAPMYESKPGWWIAKQMAKRLKLEDYFPWTDPQDHLRRLIAPMKLSETELMSLGAVAFDGKPYIEDRTENDGPLFPTQSGKIELLSSVLKDLNLDALPKYEAVEPPPAGMFRFIYGRAPVHSFSRSENNAWLDDIMPENPVWLNSEVAAQLGMHDGQKVVLENQDGVKSSVITLKTTPGIRKDVVFGVHGFGAQSSSLKKAFQHGFSDNALMSRIAVDPLTGGTGMRVNFVRIHAEKG
ncbi:MAG TPA: molybdopterin-dependent oxidoreductase [candidate division Zixibacteria bacterium]|nr:molybdopterin-dependent oxidoreductase [candidate division Zixibacteria bacterium]